MAFDPQPVVLEGRHVRLEPLGLHHAEPLLAIARDASIWTYLMIPPPANLGDVRQWIEDALQAQRFGTELPFATIRRGDGKVVGSTRFIDIRRAHRGLEIGWTWLAPEAQRTPINTEAKYLMLRHAFEALGAIRVQLKTDENNRRSRRAIERIGGAFEGVLRNHMLRAHDGYVRNTAMYGLVDREWPAAKSRLEAMLAR